MATVQVLSPTQVLDGIASEPTTPTSKEMFPLPRPIESEGTEICTYSIVELVGRIATLERKLDDTRTMSLHALEMSRVESLSNDMLAKELRSLLETIQDQLDAERKLSEQNLEIANRNQRIGMTVGIVGLTSLAALLFAVVKSRPSRR
mmetsp:Transcript_9241/g.56219  ORF Transcript_9241/g.56219 Transcript_9241/m.56219 type:complete len:148 (+) Transcript_9241:457-900(+)